MMLCLHLASVNGYVTAQDKSLVQIKVFDQQLQPMKNIEVAINDHDFIAVNNRGTGFIELKDSELPLKTVRIKDETLEAASWNYSKGTVEIIVRKKSYNVIQVTLVNTANAAVPNVRLTYNGPKPVTVTTDRQGQVQLPLPLGENITSTSQFSLTGYRLVSFNLKGKELVLKAAPLSGSSRRTSGGGKSADKTQDKRDLTGLDSIQSIAAFFDILKNYPIQELSATEKQMIDARFDQLLSELRDSLLVSERDHIQRISDSSYVGRDIANLLAHAKQEGELLEQQHNEFGEKVKLMNDKLAGGLINLSKEEQDKLAADLITLENILLQNENTFNRNHQEYLRMISLLKASFGDFKELENRLTISEAKRLEEQKAFRERLLAISILVIVFAGLIVMLVRFSNKLRKQRSELIRVNAEIKLINENLEGLVEQRTKLLADANKELDTFLYRASHDLRSPVCSIVGLCNIALHFSNGESKDLVEKVVHTTFIMDRLLKKLSIISEINQPTNYSSIPLYTMMLNVAADFKKVMKDQPAEIVIDCPEDLVIESYPNLVETIIVNLLENALFYSLIKNPSGARVELKARVMAEDLELVVYDNGIGVHDAIRDRLFDMFFKGNERSKGNGLGLYIVQKSVQALQGRITVESEYGIFTKFIVVLPLTPAQGEDNFGKLRYEELTKLL